MTDDLRAYQAMLYRRRHPIPSAQGRTWRRGEAVVAAPRHWECTACGHISDAPLAKCGACGHVRLRPVPYSLPPSVDTGHVFLPQRVWKTGTFEAKPANATL